MAKSFENSSLAKLWSDDALGTGGRPSIRAGAKIIQLPSGSTVKQEIIKYYQDHGLENIAKEAGVINSNGEIITTASTPGTPTTPKSGQGYVALPIVQASNSTTAVTTTTPIKMTPLKLERQSPILPKGTPLNFTPVQIINTPPAQRNPSQAQHYVGVAAASPRTPQQQYVMSPQANTWPLKRQPEANEYPLESKRSRKGEKGGKGLRHFSMKVCEKVKQKGTTSYNEVADELVSEFTDPSRMFPGAAPQSGDQTYDQKNIRRRVYDALNVLMAMNIISKEKKEIRWLGLPTNSAQECHNLEEQKQKSLKRIKLKMQQLQELLIQQIAYKNLVERNRELERQNKAPPINATLQLPFILVNTSNNTVVDCSISSNKMEYLFNFSDRFEIHDDIEVLKRLGLGLGLDKPGTCTPEQLEKACKMVPKSLEPYVVHMGTVGGDLPPGMPSTSTNSQPSMSSGSDIADGESGNHDPPSRTCTPSEDFSDYDSEPSSPGE